MSVSEEAKWSKWKDISAETADSVSASDPNNTQQPITRNLSADNLPECTVPTPEAWQSDPETAQLVVASLHQRWKNRYNMTPANPTPEVNVVTISVPTVYQVPESWRNT